MSRKPTAIAIAMEVVEDLAAHGNATPIELIANELGGERGGMAKARRVIKQLIKARKLVHVGGSFYELA